MSDQEMQFFPDTDGGQQHMSAFKNWSPEQPSVPPELLPAYCAPEEKVDTQSLERVWGRLEEHVSRNREAYRDNRNVPALCLPSSPAFSAPEAACKPFLRTLPWRRLDMIAALLFLTLLMGSLLTVVYNVLPHTQSGAPGEASSPSQTVCKGMMAASQQVTLVESAGGVRMLPSMVVVRQGGHLIWINQTRSDQVIVDASTKMAAMKVALHAKEQGQPLLKASTYTYYVQSGTDQSSKLPPALTKGAQVVVEVLNIVLIVSGNDGAGNVFQPDMMKVPQGSDLVWLNTTPEQQFVVNTAHKQAGLFSLAPNSCQLQHDIQAGSYNYTLKGSVAQFSLYAG
ncbi:MAG TPA: hypothetical protein VL485_13825 [Ktedonobacteraceae bacterium]|jgi:hypothetical protein|nr:hypothetical protein [Ktedonobacteraceae bacterium]